MDSKRKFKKSKVAAVIASCFLGGLFWVGMSDPPIYFILVYGGIVLSSIVAIYYWRAERRKDAKTSPIGLLIVMGVLVLLILLCLLPALPGLLR
jgi:multisubunit Na+/H+ antiporter MnhB subunit